MVFKNEKKKIKTCRVCKNNFFNNPLLVYKNMPKAAQYLPDRKSLNSDKGINLEVHQCSNCGLVQLNNKPVLYYREVIRASAVSKEMINFRIKQFKKFIDQFNLKKKKILEVGCGKGEYLSIMNKLGAETYGLEYAKESVKFCKKQNLNVFQGFIEKDNYNLKFRPFDSFFILSFLEHIPNINLFLKGLYDNLKIDGVGLIEVPNFDMILKKNLFSEFINDHLFYFTKDTLHNTLKINGFEVISSSVVWHNYIISVIVKKINKKNIKPFYKDKKTTKKIDIKHFYKYQEKIKNEILNFIDNFPNKKVEIWGAGHQSLALISLAKLKNKISYVIDSAIIKQNK